MLVLYFYPKDNTSGCTKESCTIRSTVIVGPDGVVCKHWPTVKQAETHPHDVLAFLKSR